MPSTTENLIRRNCIPIIYTKGTHYEVGFDVGRTFATIIQNFLNNTECLPDYIEAYNSLEGKIRYDSTLCNLKKNFPQYIEELEGTADGASVPFYKLFLLHMDNIILSATSSSSSSSRINLQPTGCSTICVNEKGQEFIGHTEDALAATLNHFYLVSAHIIEAEPRGKWAIKEEKFTSLCYAGHLPGYTMSYNHHGLVYSINTLCAKDLRPGKTPRHFLARALLGAENFVTAQQILRDSGTGAGDGCSINLTFLKQDGNRMMHNIEMGPVPFSEEILHESQLNILTISSGEFIMHTNSYLRLNIEEANPVMMESSVQRLKTFRQYKEPRNEEDIKKMLSDKSNCVHSVFRDKNEDFVQTICVGIFNLRKKTWSLYADAPKDNDPLVVLPLQLKD